MEQDIDHVTHVPNMHFADSYEEAAIANTADSEVIHSVFEAPLCCTCATNLQSYWVSRENSAECVVYKRKGGVQRLVHTQTSFPCLFFGIGVAKPRILLPIIEIF